MTGEDGKAGQEDAGGGLGGLTLVAILVGAGTGLLGALFRLSLDHAGELRNLLIARLAGHPWSGPLLVMVLCAAATALAAWLVQRFAPYASGSGIPHVEAVLRGQLPPAPYGLAPVKFAGGVLAIGAGLALGREGPSVQMGASLAVFAGRLFRRGAADCRILLAAGAGAGLATAFNAPIAGAVFVLEELVQRYEPRITIAALAASASAISVARLILGDATDFHVAALVAPPLVLHPLFFLLGAVLGVVAIVYNRGLLLTLDIVQHRVRLPGIGKAAIIGAAVGALAWSAPDLVGGGDALTQSALDGSGTAAAIAGLFVLRFALGAISYAAGTPGGLFAPLLVLGAQAGLLFGLACQTVFPGTPIQPGSFALVGLAAFFGGVVRAPVTGIVLVTEMTANVTLLLPMLAACSTAMLVTTGLRSQPIYDLLRERLLSAGKVAPRATGNDDP